MVDSDTPQYETLKSVFFPLFMLQSTAYLSKDLMMCIMYTTDIGLANGRLKN
jgi:hypothetical protein